MYMYVPSLPAALDILQQIGYMAIRFSEAFKGLQLTDLVYFKRYYFVPTWCTSQPFFHIIAALMWCIAALRGEGVTRYWPCLLALYGAHSMLCGNSSM